MSDFTVEESYQWCVDVARRQAKNFYYSFLLLSLPQREAMCAIYAFMRYCDDLSDDEGIADRASAIARWRDDLEAALHGQSGEHPLWPAFVDAVERYKIPHQYFFDMIDGVSSDLEPRCVQTFAELYDYCYHVASVVGLTIIHIFGFDDPKALELAEKCGIAFQLTNILRDVREDYEKDRVYIPAEDFRRFGVSQATLISTEGFLQMMDFEAKRARDYYRESAPLVALIHPHSRASLKALIGIYSRLLDRIVESNFDVLTRRIRVPAWEKLWILGTSKFRW
ncbi:MAG TPA: phytoene/squalene synthase family protein [Bryobacteraceae bacterium]|jgi:phytoene synthase|nr:phytoene/squalene synthase family protein [Bryobacteraceae bacterium]